MINAKVAEIQIIDSGKSEISKSNISIATSAFYELIEKKNVSVYSELMHPELKIRKNNEIWNYEQTFEYIQNLNDKYTSVTFLPFEMVIATGDYVTVKYTERIFSEDGSVESHRFISIFEIRDGRILNVWELAVAVDEDPEESAESGIPLSQIDGSGDQVGGTDQL
jgi:ketosteroid isomerase-like protein